MLDHFRVPIEDQVLVNREDLHRVTAHIFSVMGLSQEDANLAADGLVTADIRGCETHGVSNMLRVYKKLYEACIRRIHNTITNKACVGHGVLLGICLADVYRW